VWFVWMALLGSMALAQDIPEEEEALDIPDVDPTPGTQSGFDVGAAAFEVEDEDDEDGMVDYNEQAKRRPPEPTNFHLYADGKKPFGNDFPMHTVALNSEWLKLELPVLVAQSRADFLAVHPHGVRVIAEWDVGGQKTTQEQVLPPDRIWAAGPTFAFMTLAVRDGRKTAPVQVKVKTADLPPPPAADGAAEPPPPPSAPKVRFAVTSVFYRKG